MGPGQATAVAFMITMMMSSLENSISQALTRPPGSYILPMLSSAVSAQPLEGINLTTPLQGPRSMVEPSTGSYGLVLFQLLDLCRPRRTGRSFLALPVAPAKELENNATLRSVYP